MNTPYVQDRDGNLYVGQSRVTVDTVIAQWQAGRTPEEIQASFDATRLAAVYGTIAFYLDHQDELDGFFRETEAMDEARQAAAEAARPEFYAGPRNRLAQARERLDREAPVAWAPWRARDRMRMSMRSSRTHWSSSSASSAESVSAEFFSSSSRTRATAASERRNAAISSRVGPRAKNSMTSS